MKIKNLSAVLLAVVLVFSLCACGASVDPNDPNQGKWIATRGEMFGLSMDVEDLFGDGFIIELKNDGKCTLTADGKKADGKWTLSDGAFTIKGGGVDCQGRLENGTLSLDNVMDMGLTLVFEKEGASAENAVPTATSGVESSIQSQPPQAPKTLSEGYAWWDGQWYGWYNILEGVGDFSWMDGDQFDCAAFLDMNSDGTGTFFLWDDYEVLATIEVSVDLNAGGGVMGELTTVSGTLFDVDVKEGHWYTDPTDEVEENFFYIYTDVRTSNDDYARFEIYLRPWGLVWDDMPSGMLPPEYDGWYIDAEFVKYASMLDALADTTIDGNPVFIHPDLPDRAYTTTNDGAVTPPSSSVTTPPAPDTSEGFTAPAGGDGITSLTYDELNAIQKEFHKLAYEDQLKKTYEEIVSEYLDGIEGESRNSGFANRWSYAWYATDYGRFQIIFNAETGGFYSMAMYDVR